MAELISQCPKLVPTLMQAMAESNIDNNNSFLDLIIDAEKEYEKGNYNLAIAKTDQALEINEVAGAYNIRGMSKLELGEYYGAISDFQNAIKIDSTISNFYSNLGLAKMYLGDFISSEKIF